MCLLYLWYLFWAKTFRFQIESWPEIRTHGLVLTVHTLLPLRSLAERWDALNELQHQATTRFKSSLGDCSDQVWITLAANFLYFCYFHSRSPTNTKTSQRRPKTSHLIFGLKDVLRLVSNGSRDDLFKGVVNTSSRRRPKDVLQETFLKPLPRDVIKTSNTSSRLFLVKAKYHLNPVYGFSIYLCFKLHTYYHCIIR